MIFDNAMIPSVDDSYVEEAQPAAASPVACALQPGSDRRLPLSEPGPGEQYAFDVSLDACSGCQACVIACHHLNGLSSGETWRRVGVLLGGTEGDAFLRYITTSCHHCIEPACALGCPVGAYEKDAETGIVRHLDDQCIGCQYCLLTCPYEAPVYVKEKGIVRKCDMCHQRLRASQAPACVEACPTGAIRIQVVSRDAVIQASDLAPLLPGAPDPSHTMPTTRYRSERAFPLDARPADYDEVRISPSHPSLVTMLVLTQMAVGAFVAVPAAGAGLALVEFSSGTVLARGYAVWSLFWGTVGLLASLFHLGRPHLAFRAVYGLRSSWLSREVLAFGLFAAAVF